MTDPTCNIHLTQNQPTNLFNPLPYVGHVGLVGTELELKSSTCLSNRVMFGLTNFDPPSRSDQNCHPNNQQMWHPRCKIFVYLDKRPMWIFYNYCVFPIFLIYNRVIHASHYQTWHTLIGTSRRDLNGTPKTVEELIWLFWKIFQWYLPFLSFTYNLKSNTRQPGQLNQGSLIPSLAFYMLHEPHHMNYNIQLHSAMLNRITRIKEIS